MNKMKDEVNALTGSLYSMLSTKSRKDIEEEVSQHIELDPSKWD
jgi:hypothetical protein